MRGLKRFMTVSVSVAVGLVSGCSSRSLDDGTGPRAPRVGLSTVGCDGTAESRGLALRAAVVGAAPGAVVQLGACDYHLYPDTANGSTDGITIANAGLTLQGAGTTTRIWLDRQVYLGLSIVTGAHDIVIRNLKIEGEITQTPDSGGIVPPHTHGVASGSGQSGIHDIEVSDIEVTNVAVGISVGSEVSGVAACVPGRYVTAHILHNYVHHVRGTMTGSGYGLHTGCAEHVVMRDNLIERAERHSIYVAKSLSVGQGALDDITVINNAIVEHAPINQGDAVKRVALVVARSYNVSVVGNTIVGSREYPMSVEDDDLTGFPTGNVALIGNHILRRYDCFGVRPNCRDIWLNTASSVTLWHNTFNDTPHHETQVQSNLAVVQSDHGVTIVNPTLWAIGKGTQWIEEMDGMLYVMQNDRLHAVTPAYGTSPSTWSYAASSTVWTPSFQAMAVTGGHLFVMQNNVLHQVTPQASSGAWPYAASTTQWLKFASMVGIGGDPYVVQNDVLHHVTPGANGTVWSYVYQVLPIADSAAAMRPSQRALFLVHDAPSLTVAMSMYNPASLTFMGYFQ